MSVNAFPVVSEICLKVDLRFFFFTLLMHKFDMMPTTLGAVQYTSCRENKLLNCYKKI
jgi:hypothetical protein